MVRVFTKDFGKMDVLAKGARKTTSKLNAHLDVLNHARIQFVRNGERLPTLMDAEIISKFEDWFLSEGRISLASRILQTLDNVILPGAQDEKLFLMAIDFFSAQGARLPDGQGPALGGRPEETAIYFLRKFFAHEGYGDSLPEEHEEAIIKQWPALKN